MGIFADVFSFSNALEIGDLQQQNQSQLRLAEFRERADMLSRQTGVAPLGFFAFEKANPTPVEHAPAARWWGMVLGTAAGAFFPPLGIPIGAIAGFTLGAISTERESNRLTRAMDRYDAYLSSAETMAYAQMRAPSLSMEGAGQGHSTTHAADILAERAAQAAAERTI